MKSVVRRRIRALSDATEYAKEISVAAVSVQYGIPEANIVDLSLNINPYGPPAAAVRRASEMLQTLNRYPDVSQQVLRRRLSTLHGVTPEMIVLGNGLDGLLKMIAQTFVERGDHVVIPVPTFPRYALEVMIMGGHVDRLLLGEGFELPLDEMLSRITSDTKLVFLCSPNNPTGVPVGRAAVEALLELGDRGPLIIVDEALAFLGYEGCVNLVSSHRNLMVLRTFSKAYGLAGARVGYGVADAELVAYLEVVRPPFNVNLLGAPAALGALEDDAFLRVSQSRLAAERETVAMALQKLEGLATLSSDTNLLTVDVRRSGWTSTELVEALACRGVLLTDCRSYAGLEEMDLVRISLGRRKDNQILVRTLEALWAEYGLGFCS